MSYLSVLLSSWVCVRVRIKGSVWKIKINRGQRWRDVMPKKSEKGDDHRPCECLTENRVTPHLQLSLCRCSVQWIVCTTFGCRRCCWRRSLSRSAQWSAASCRPSKNRYSLKRRFKVSFSNITFDNGFNGGKTKSSRSTRIAYRLSHNFVLETVIK